MFCATSLLHIFRPLLLGPQLGNSYAQRIPLKERGSEVGRFYAHLI
jgi:hypothetical protein